MTNLSHYGTLVFDCDGVVLDSNQVKTAAFRSAAMPYGAAAADALVAYHVANGGISRYVKFAHFLERIVPEHGAGAVPGRDGPDHEALLQIYAETVRDGLMNCGIATGLEQLRSKTRGANWLIVSGGDQNELREVFAARGISDLFDGGIFGSPDTKSMILDRELSVGTRRPLPQGWISSSSTAGPTWPTGRPTLSKTTSSQLPVLAILPAEGLR